MCERELLKLAFSFFFFLKALDWTDEMKILNVLGSHQVKTFAAWMFKISTYNKRHIQFYTAHLISTLILSVYRPLPLIQNLYYVNSLFFKY